ncbi:hypothetical protein GCM10010371_48810 [Streptomyces subrutilus]|uniref:Uncharacterized protein n=1 Tax=Streptomyces subrutilus TaxID=36818 RepID=A0A918VA69_9ACTN|nr:hypothetical protein GCM10010371_48810 [Streptomyces subrutilus]
MLVEQFRQPQFHLVRVGGLGTRAGVRVDHQQMDRVRTHIEDTESHRGKRYCGQGAVGG